MILPLMPIIPWDLSLDHTVNGRDLGLLLLGWEDGTIERDYGPGDLGDLLLHWGETATEVYPFGLVFSDRIDTDQATWWVQSNKPPERFIILLAGRAVTTSYDPMTLGQIDVRVTWTPRVYVVDRHRVWLAADQSITTPPTRRFPGGTI